MEAFREWYARCSVHSAGALGITGIHAQEIDRPALSNLPEEACLKAALPSLCGPTGAVNLVRIGARGYSVLTRDEAGLVQHLENEKCSSGTGETMVKIAGRFGLSIEEADRLACSADEEIPITARCSVFAKSEMTHFGNQGRPAAPLFSGYFRAVTRYVAALLARNRVPGPILLIGGGARLEAVRQCLAEVTGAAVTVPDDAQILEALGAAILAAEEVTVRPPAPLPADPSDLVQSKERRFSVLPPPRRSSHRVTRQTAPPVPAGAVSEPTILGLDLGSTGSKAALTSVRTGELVLDLYDKTRGNPVDAVQRLVQALLRQRPLDIRAIGLTGSGREAAAVLFNALFAPDQERILVLNEIVAHATAAVRCDGERDGSLSVVEIGGQDAKFIQLVDRHIVESDMNKACSAGTGSFLEEQARFYGVTDIEEFAQMAEQGGRPPELGQMCTVFVAHAAAEALDQGFATEDIFAGFQYSVIHNYINRVMGQRTLGERIFFQGKPASSPSLAWALAEVTGREVFVPPNPGAMGAWGIGLCAREELGLDVLESTSALDLAELEQVQVVKRSEFRCRDKKCNTLCVIERTTVEVAGSRQQMLSGGACPKFEEAGAGRHKLPKEAPSAFDERERLIAQLVPRHRNSDRSSPALTSAGGVARPLRATGMRHPRSYPANASSQRSTHRNSCDGVLEPPPAGNQDQPVIGLPHVGALQGILPWAVTLLQELGFGVRVLRSDKDSLCRGEERCHSYDACSPVKVAHGVADADVDLLFFPKLLDLPDPAGPGGKTCPLEQALPELVEQAVKAKRGSGQMQVLRPRLALQGGFTGAGVLRALSKTLASLAPSRLRRLPKAMARAAVVQRAHQEELEHIGRRTLDFGREHGLPVVVVVGSLHVMHDQAVNASIPAALRQNGVLALPMDCYPLSGREPPLPEAVWAEANRAFRVALTARSNGQAFPLLLTSFGCGPGSFAEPIFSMLMEGYPHTALETDGHGGTAGYVTRIQAFLHTVRQYQGGPSPASEEQLRLLDPVPEPPLKAERDSQIVIFTLGERLAPLTAAYFRSEGFDAVPAAPNNSESYHLGRGDCSGKECLPYQMLWGTFRQHLKEHPPQKRTLLLQITGTGMCRNCMFSLKDRITLRRLGLDGLVGLRHLRPEPGHQINFVTRYWSALVTWDILQQFAAYYRATALDPEAVDQHYNQYCDELEALLEQPPGRGLSRLKLGSKGWRELNQLLDRASRTFAELPRSKPNGVPRRTVLLSGDIYLRLDDYGNDDLVKRLNQRGLQVLLEPTCVLVEYMADERSAEIVGLPTGRLLNGGMRALLSIIRSRLYDRVRPLHPWLPMPDVPEMQRQARTLLDRYPVGEAPITLGSVLHNWQQRTCDGAVMVNPWGCGPALIAESLLRHQREIPTLFVYSDGTPIDERRLDAFAFRLQRTEANCWPGPSS